jgi:hypothetical protein
MEDKSGQSCMLIPGDKPTGLDGVKAKMDDVKAKMGEKLEGMFGKKGKCLDFTKYMANCP